MGLKGTTEIKKALKKMAPDAWVAGPISGVHVIIDDATGCVYQTISSATEFRQLKGLKKDYLQAVRASALDADTYVAVFDLESNKPSNKSYLRNIETESYQPLTGEEILKHGHALCLDAEEEDFVRAAGELHQKGLDNKDCSERSNPVTFALSRMLRTHILRNELFCEFIESMMSAMREEFPPFRRVAIDGMESLDERNKFIMKRIVAGKDDCDEDCGTARAGEADLRIIEVLHHLFRRKPQSVVVRSKDTDLIVLLMLDVSNWPSGANVALNLGPGKRDGPDEFINIRLLRTQLREWATKTFGEAVSPPIAVGDERSGFDRVFSLVAMMAGTDYVLKPAGLGWQRLWNFFEDIGFSLFHGVDLVPPPEGSEAFAEWHAGLLDTLEHFVRAMLSADHKQSKKYGPRHERYNNMKQRVIKNFVAPKKVDRPHAAAHREARRKLMKRVPSCPDVIMEVGERRPLQGIVPQTQDWIRVYCGQIVWNYLYWHIRAVDPLQEACGRPVWGWKRAASADGAHPVVRADVLHWPVKADDSPWIAQRELQGNTA